MSDASDSSLPPIVLRDLAPRDARPLTELLGGVFEREYSEQKLDIAKFRRYYWLMAWANRVLRPLSLEFFKVTVAEVGGELAGAITSFRANRRAWYQGFGVMGPAARGRGLYKRLIRTALQDIARQGARVVGGEIRPDNEPALRPYRDNFATEILPVKHIHLAAPERLPTPARRLDLVALSARQLAEHPSVRALFEERTRGGFLVEGEVERTLLGAIARWLLPPLTVRTWGWLDGDRLCALARVRTHWPARIQALDVVYFERDLPRDTGRDFLLSVLDRVRHETRSSIRIYVDPADLLLAELCGQLELPLLAPLCPIRMDVRRALARTDAAGSEIGGPGLEGEVRA